MENDAEGEKKHWSDRNNMKNMKSVQIMIIA